MFLRQSTTTTIQLGPFLDSTDGDTEEIGFTISSTDVFLSKAGAAFANPNDTNGATHDRDGWFRKQLNATDTNTVGRFRVYVHESGGLYVWHDFTILPAPVYDALIAGTTTEPTAVPSATASFISKLDWLFFLGRNKLEQTASKTTVYDDAGTSAVAESTIADNGTTLTRGEFTDSP